MAIVFPHVFADGPGNVASGVQVMENLEALKAAIEKLQGVGVKYTTKSYSKAEAEAGVEPSATDPAIVTLVTISNSEKVVTAEYLVDGKLASEVAAGVAAGGSSKTPSTVWVPAAKKWALQAGSVQVSSVTALTLIL